MNYKYQHLCHDLDGDVCPLVDKDWTLELWKDNLERATRAVTWSEAIETRQRSVENPEYDVYDGRVVQCIQAGPEPTTAAPTAATEGRL